MLAVTAILSCVIKFRGLFKSTKWRHFENVKFEALSARREVEYAKCIPQLKTHSKQKELERVWELITKDPEWAVAHRKQKIV